PSRPHRRGGELPRRQSRKRRRRQPAPQCGKYQGARLRRGCRRRPQLPAGTVRSARAGAARGRDRPHYRKLRRQGAWLVRARSRRLRRGGRRTALEAAAYLVRRDDRGGMNEAAAGTRNIAATAAELLAPHGLILRGGFDFAEGEEAPAGPSGAPAKALLLVGQAGASIWPHFERWRAAQPAGLAHPLDTWARMVIGEAADALGARAVSPSDRPFLPFQQWVMRAEKLKPSPLGILMHPEFGLWHAFRGALLFDRPLGLRDVEAPIHLCDACVGKPCLSACPVGAYAEHG